MGAEGALEDKFIVDSSFVADTPEVLDMRGTFKEKNGFHIFIYEPTQNAIDYSPKSDDPADKPFILCVLPDGKRILSSELTDETPDPVRIEFHNKIAGSEGLEPFQIGDIAHTAKGPTLGKHGRGGTVAAATGLIDGHISSIDYVSKARNAQGEVYSWKGKGVMRVLDPVHQKTPRFVVEFEYVPDDVLETVVGIDNPDKMVIDALKAFPANFLPANPRYEGCRLRGSEGIAKVPNLMSIQIGNSPNGQSFTEADVERMFYSATEIVQDVAPKVEILADSLVGRDPSSKVTDHAYEGGLRLRGWGWGSKYALNWAFDGFGDPRIAARYGYNPSRSKNSILIDGKANDLIAVTLRYCENPVVFTKILENCVEVGSKEVCVEAEIDPEIFTDLSPKTMAALLVAWRKMAQERGLSQDTLITQDEGIKRRLEQEGRRAVIVKSPAISQVLIQALGLQDATQALGIKEVVKETGEHMLYTRGDLEEHRHRAVSGLIKFMSESNGSVDIAQGRITADLASVGNFQGRYADLPITLRGFIEDYLSAGGSLRLKVADTVFEMEMKGPLIKGAGATMIIKKGTSFLQDANGLTIDILASEFQEEQVRTSCLAEISEKLGRYIKADGSIDWGNYRASSIGTIADLDRQIALRERRLRERAYDEVRRNENGLARRLLRQTRDLLSWSNVARLSSIALVAGSVVFGSGRILNELGKRGVEIPIVQVSTNTIDLAGFRITLPFRESFMQSSSGMIMPRFEDRLPDRISPAELRGLRPFAYADILQLPKNEFSGQNGEAIGYFPVEQFVEGKPLALQNHSKEPFRGAYRVNSLDQVALATESDDILVYKPNVIYQSLYPPSGWEIINIYQVGGKNPLINTEKALYWENAKDIPSEAIVMVRRVKEETIDNSSDRIRSLGKASPFSEYDPKFDITKAMDLNSRLKNDPQLQSLHKNFLQEMIVWQISENKDRVQAAAIATKYLTLFAQYSNTRGYGLDFQINKKGTGFDSILSIAEDPQAKYFCSVASNVTKELLESMGIRVANQPGNTLFNINGTLFADLAHQNNVIFLPDGTLLLVDNTPYVRPGDEAVLDALRPSRGTAVGATTSPEQMQRIERLRRNIQKGGGGSLPPQLFEPEEVIEQVQAWNGIGNVAVETGIPIAAAALAYFAIRRFTPGLREREIRKRLERSVKENGLTSLEFRLVAAVEDHLVNGNDQIPQAFESTSQEYLDLMLQFNLREQGPALQWFVERPEGLAAIVGENGVLSIQETFAKVSAGYAARGTEVADRFPPSLRTSFLEMNQLLARNEHLTGEELSKALRGSSLNIPSEFRTLYDLAVLIQTRGEGNASVLQGRTEVIDDIIRRKLARGEIGSSKIGLVNALYQQLTGKRLKEALAQAKEQEGLK